MTGRRADHLDITPQSRTTSDIGDLRRRLGVLERQNVASIQKGYGENIGQLTITNTNPLDVNHLAFGPFVEVAIPTSATMVLVTWELFYRNTTGDGTNIFLRDSSGPRSGGNPMLVGAPKGGASSFAQTGSYVFWQESNTVGFPTVVALMGNDIAPGTTQTYQLTYAKELGGGGTSYVKNARLWVVVL